MKEENKLLCDNCKKLLETIPIEETKLYGCFYALCYDCGIEQSKNRRILQ